MDKLPVPPPDLRVGAGRRQDDAQYITSAVTIANRLISACGVSPEHAVLDIGCGQARLLRGLMHRVEKVGRYVGVDVHEPSIRWLEETIAPLVPWAEFVHFPYRNERYNPSGEKETIDLQLGRFDRIALFSVFSHMLLADISPYLAFIRSSLAGNGKVCLTLFVEDGVDAETENPANYLGRRWTRPLHCVLLNREEFERRVRAAGLEVETFRYRNMSSAQSLYVLTA